MPFDTLMKELGYQKNAGKFVFSLQIVPTISAYLFVAFPLNYCESLWCICEIFNIVDFVTI